MSLLRAREAAEYLNISLATLYRIEKDGGLMPFRTSGGHRRYSLAMLNEYLERSRQPSLSSGPLIQQAETAQENKRPHNPLRILVADDEPDTVGLIIRALREDRCSSDDLQAGPHRSGYDGRRNRWG
jgi:excisionase family DNA binding protein